MINHTRRKDSFTFFKYTGRQELWKDHQEHLKVYDEVEEILKKDNVAL